MFGFSFASVCKVDDNIDDDTKAYEREFKYCYCKVVRFTDQRGPIEKKVHSR